MNLSREDDESLLTMLDYIAAREDELEFLQQNIFSLRALAIKIDYELYKRGINVPAQ